MVAVALPPSGLLTVQVVVFPAVQVPEPVTVYPVGRAPPASKEGIEALVQPVTAEVPGLLELIRRAE